MTPFRRGLFHLAMGAGVGRAFGFLSNLLLSRWLGPSALGIFNLVTTTVQTSDTLVRFGGDYALNFELGGKQDAITTDQGFAFARAFTQLCTLATIFVSIVIGIWLWFGNGIFPNALNVIDRPTFSFFLLLMIATEAGYASAWEILLVRRMTAQLAMKQGLFFPLRLLFAAAGALLHGIEGSMAGWSLVSVAQGLWLKSILGDFWQPFHIFPVLFSSLSRLIRRGFPFYASNLLASLIFYPLLIKVASASGLSEVGYLRVGQVLQQIFAFVPATLVPLLFLKLRSYTTFGGQVTVVEKPIRIIWFLLIEILLIYCAVDHYLISFLFGSGFASAVLPTRLLLITALFESLSQLVVQPVLAAGRMRMYGLWQNSSALLAAILGWAWIPSAGLGSYLIIRLFYVILPFIAFGTPVFLKLSEPRRILILVFTSAALLLAFLLQVLYPDSFTVNPILFLIAFMLILIAQRSDLCLLKQIIRPA